MPPAHPRSLKSNLLASVNYSIDRDDDLALSSGCLCFWGRWSAPCDSGISPTSLKVFFLPNKESTCQRVSKWGTTYPKVLLKLSKWFIIVRKQELFGPQFFSTSPRRICLQLRQECGELGNELRRQSKRQVMARLRGFGAFWGYTVFVAFSSIPIVSGHNL